MNATDHAVLSCDPVLFAFERFGRFSAPESPTAWLSRKGSLLKDSKKRKAGERSSGMAGTSIYISDSRVLVFGPDYPECGFRASGASSEAMPHFWRSLMSAPAERWMMIVFGNAATPLSALHLNLPGDAITRAYSAKSGLVSVRHRVLAEAAACLQAGGIKSVALLHLAQDVLSENDISAADRKKFDKAVAQYPALPSVALRLARADVPPSMVARYIGTILKESSDV